MGLQNRNRDFTTYTLQKLESFTQGETGPCSSMAQFWSKYGSCFDTDLSDQCLKLDTELSEIRALMGVKIPSALRTIVDMVETVDRDFANTTKEAAEEIDNVTRAVTMLTQSISQPDFDTSFDSMSLLTKLADTLDAGTIIGANTANATTEWYINWALQNGLATEYHINGIRYVEFNELMYWNNEVDLGQVKQGFMTFVEINGKMQMFFWHPGELAAMGFDNYLDALNYYASPKDELGTPHEGWGVVHEPFGAFYPNPLEYLYDNYPSTGWADIRFDFYHWRSADLPDELSKSDLKKTANWWSRTENAYEAGKAILAFIGTRDHEKRGIPVPEIDHAFLDEVALYYGGHQGFLLFTGEIEAHVDMLMQRSLVSITPRLNYGGSTHEFYQDACIGDMDGRRFDRPKSENWQNYDHADWMAIFWGSNHGALRYNDEKKDWLEEVLGRG